MADRLMTREELLGLIKKHIPDGPPPIPPKQPKRDPRLGILSKDPMSPYNIPSTPNYYKNIADVMNNKQFPAYYPQSYTPISPYFLENRITPYFVPGEDTDYAYGALTVAGMVELTKMGAPWRLTNENDLDIVLAIAEYYRKTMEQHMHDPKISSYAKGVDVLIRVLLKGRDQLHRRQGKLQPGALDVLTIIQRFLRT